MALVTLGSGGPGAAMNCRGEKQTKQRKGFLGTATVAGGTTGVR